MRVRITTRHRSVYEIDTEAHTWKQLQGGVDVDPLVPLRTTEGRYLTISEIAKGQRVSLLCPPIVPGTLGRWISTSPVVSCQNVWGSE